MKRKPLLMVFLKSPRSTGPASDLSEVLGEENAIALSDKLLQVSLSSTKSLSCDKAVYYPLLPGRKDAWSKAGFKQFEQEGINPGHIYEAAFMNAFGQGYKSVIAICGSSFELNSRQLSKGFELLKSNDVVVGPSVDGGYYLIGMRKMYPALFKNKPWNTGSLLKETIRELLTLDLSFEGLPETQEDTIEIGREEELSEAHI